MDRYQYLVLMGLCVLITLPLEWVFGARVWRQARRALLAILPVAAIFAIWDIAAARAGHWDFNPDYVTGWEIPGGLPVEEIVFFLVIPLCGLLTLEAVRALLGRRL